MKTYHVGTQKVRVKKEKGIVKIFISGTNEWEDLPVSIKCKRNWLGYHSGAFHEAHRVASFLVEKHIILPGTIIYIGGHSMGGSIAECLDDLIYTDKIVTFGQYPVTSKETKNITRYRKGFDLVTFLFPWFRSRKYTQLKGTFNPVKDHKSYDFSLFWDME